MKASGRTTSLLYLFIFILLVLVSSGLIIYNSYSHGKLALPPVYDDVAYFSKVLERLMLLRDQGLGVLFNDIYTQGIHSYHSEILSFISYIIIGPYIISPNILTVWFLLVLAWVLLSTTMMGVNSTTLLALLLFLSLPLTSNILLAMRPDFIAYFCMALGLYLYNRKNTSYLPGVLIAYALIAKFTVAPLMIVLLVIAFVLRIMTGGQGWKNNIFAAIRGSRKTVFTILALSLPFYLFNYEHFNQYFYTVVFGEQKELWAVNQRTSVRLLYLLTGSAAQFSLGKAYYLFYPVILLQLGFLWRSDRNHFYTYANYFALIVCAYLILTSANVKTVFLDAAIPIMVVVLFFDCLGYWARKIRPKWPLHLALILGVFANVYYLKPANFGVDYSPEEIAFYSHAVADLEAIAKITGANQKIFVPVSAQLNRDTLAVEYLLVALKENLPTFKFRGTGYLGDMKWQVTQIRKYNYIFYPNKRYFEKRISKKPVLSGHTDVSISTINRELHNRNHYQIVKRYDQGDQAEIVLYRNLQLE